MELETTIISAAIHAVTSEGTKVVIEKIRTFFKNHNVNIEFDFTYEDLEKNINKEVMDTSKWAYDDIYKSHRTDDSINSKYVHLDLLLEPRKEHTNKTQLLRKCPLKDIILENKSNIVILGQPGSGKTTSIKYIVNSVLRDADFLNDVYRYPIVVRLRELNKSNSILSESQEGGIFEKLSFIFGLNFDIEYKREQSVYYGEKKK